MSDSYDELEKKVKTCGMFDEHDRVEMIEMITFWREFKKEVPEMSSFWRSVKVVGRAGRLFIWILASLAGLIASVNLIWEGSTKWFH